MAGAVTYDDWMSENDALMWHIERDPLLRSTVTSVWLLDRAPDPERFRETLDRAAQEIPRLRQRVIADGMGIAPPRWELDPNFDPAYHVRQIGAAGDGSLRDLLDLAAPIAMQAFDRDRPLWEFHVVSGLANGRAGVVMKLHHAVSDGMGMVRMTKNLVERSREPREFRESSVAPTQDASAPRSELEHLQDAVQHRAGAAADRASRLFRALGRGLGDFARDPVSTVSGFGETLSSIGRLVKPASEPLSPVMTKRSLTVRFDALTVPLDELRSAGKAVGGTLNDAFVGAVTGGLRLYHEHKGSPVEELRMNMPINVREGEKGLHAGNQFVPARFAVPIAMADPAERMRAIQKLVRSQRAEPALPLLDEVTATINRFGIGPSTRIAGSMMKAVDMVTSNVPGPTIPVFSAGARIENMFPFGPLAGAAVNVTLFSYEGQLQIGVNTDAAAVDDPELLVDCLRKGISEVKSVA